MNRDFEVLKRQLRRRLTEEEAEKVIRNLELIYRNRAIRREYEALKNDIGSKKAIEFLAEKYYLSEKSIEAVVYGNEGKKNLKKRGPKLKRYLELWRAAHYLQIPTKQLRKMAEENFEDIPVFIINGRYVFRTDLLDKWYEKLIEKGVKIGSNS